jgi:hypothetical protein
MDGHRRKFFNHLRLASSCAVAGHSEIQRRNAQGLRRTRLARDSDTVQTSVATACENKQESARGRVADGIHCITFDQAPIIVEDT